MGNLDFVAEGQTHSFNQYIFKISAIALEDGSSDRYAGTGMHSIGTATDKSPADEQAISLFLASNPQKPGTLTVKFADEDSLLVGMLDLQEGTMEGKVYQGKQLADAIPTESNGSFSLKLSLGASLIGPWKGSLIFIEGDVRQAFDPYVISVVNMVGTAGNNGAFTGTGQHSLSSTDTDGKTTEVSTGALQIAMDAQDANKFSVKFADADSLLVGTFNAATDTIDGKLFQGKGIEDVVTGSGQGLFSLKRTTENSAVTVVRPVSASSATSDVSDPLPTVAGKDPEAFRKLPLVIANLKLAVDTLKATPWAGTLDFSIEDKSQVFDSYVVNIPAMKLASDEQSASGAGTHVVENESSEVNFSVKMRQSGSAEVMFADAESLLVGVLNVAAGTLVGKVYQGKKLGDAIPATDNGSFSLKKGAAAAAAGGGAGGGAASLGATSWTGSLEFVDGTEKSSFDHYVVDIDTVAAGAGGKYSGAGKHTISTSDAAGKVSEVAKDVVQFDIAQGSAGGDSMTVQFADAESLLVGVVNVAAGTLVGKVYQGKKLGDAIPATDNGSFSLKKGAAAAAAGGEGGAGAGNMWFGTLEFGKDGDTNPKTVFDQYVVDIMVLPSGPSGSTAGQGVHSIGSTKQTANANAAELIAVAGTSTANGILRWADSESLMVGTLDATGQVLEGRLYQEKGLADKITEATPWQGMFKLAKPASARMNVYAAVLEKLRTNNGAEADIECTEDELKDDKACQLLCTDSACTKGTK
jgi:hypothetical protein